MNPEKSKDLPIASARNRRRERAAETHEYFEDALLLFAFSLIAGLISLANSKFFIIKIFNLF